MRRTRHFLLSIALAFAAASAGSFADTCTPQPSMPFIANADLVTVKTGCISDPLYGDIENGALYFFASHYAEGAENGTCINTVDVFYDPRFAREPRIVYVFAGGPWQTPPYKGLAHDADAFWLTDGVRILPLLANGNVSLPSARARAVLQNAMVQTGRGWRAADRGIAYFDERGTVVRDVIAVPCDRSKRRIAQRILTDPLGNVWFSIPFVNRVWVLLRDGTLRYLDVPQGVAPIASDGRTVALGAITSKGVMLEIVTPNFK